VRDALKGTASREVTDAVVALGFSPAMPNATVRLQESGPQGGRAAPSFGGLGPDGGAGADVEGLRGRLCCSLSCHVRRLVVQPCVEGLPRLKAFTRKHPELRLSTSPWRRPGEAQQFAAKAGIDGPSVLDQAPS